MKTKKLLLILLSIVFGPVCFMLVSTIMAQGLSTTTICDVPSGSHPTIQSASNDSNCDIINLTAPYYNENVLVNREVTIQGQGKENTVIDGGMVAHVFMIQYSDAVTMTGLSVVNGYGSNGPGILTLNTSLTLDNVAVISNTTPITIYSNGGGISTIATAPGYALTISNSEIRNNFASARGGGIFAQQMQVEIANTDIISNASESCAAVDFVGTTLTIDASNIMLNYASNSGGGICNDFGTVMTVTNSLIQGNASGGAGGGVLVNDGAANIYQTTIISNSAYSGGGLQVNWGTLAVLNSAVVNNSADLFNHGGGINNYRGTLTVTNSTLSGNSAGFGGGIYTDGPEAEAYISASTLSGNYGQYNSSGLYSSGGLLSMVNTIIANGIGSEDCLDVGTILINLNNLIEDGTCSPALTGDPMLGLLQDNGGPTWTHALLPGSPAIDNGHPATCAAPPVNNLDQRGEPRPIDGDGDGAAICDIGSFELELPDFSLAKSGPAVAAAGEFITYTLTVTNNEIVTVTNVVLTDTIPANATYISGGTLVGNVVSWTLPQLSAGSAFSRFFVVTATQTITNDDYRVSANGGFSMTGRAAVVTIVVEPITGLTATNDSPTIVGSQTTLMAETTTGSEVTYTWAFGDGATGSGAVATHTYPAVGIYTAIVTASNPLGEVTATTAVTITDIPISGLSASNDSPTIIGNPTTLMASVSSGTNVNYTWAFGDGATGSGAVVTHTYLEAGQYTAVVTASNSAGSAVDTTGVTIEPNTWTIYLPAVLKPGANTNQTTQPSLPNQDRVAIRPSRD